MGGEMDGMDDLDAPAPPMGDGMDDDPGMDSMPDDMGGAPDDMGNDPIGGEGPEMDSAPDDMENDPMGGTPDDMGGSSEDNELMNIISNLSIEDKAAVTKYAKSMTDNGGEEPIGNPSIPESINNFKKIIDETISSLLDKKNNNGIKRPGKKINSEFRGKKTNPFVSPF